MSKKQAVLNYFKDHDVIVDNLDHDVHMNLLYELYINKNEKVINEIGDNLNDPIITHCIGYYYHHHKKNNLLAKKYYQLGADNSYFYSMMNLAYLHSECADFELGKKYANLCVTTINKKIREGDTNALIRFTLLSSMCLLAELCNKRKLYDDTITYLESVVTKSEEFYKSYETFHNPTGSDLKKSIEMCGTKALTCLGNYYCFQNNCKKAKTYFKMAIEKGDFRAMSSFALLNRDYPDIATKYYMMAFEHGFIDAINHYKRYSGSSYVEEYPQYIGLGYNIRYHYDEKHFDNKSYRLGFSNYYYHHDKDKALQYYEQFYDVVKVVTTEFSKLLEGKFKRNLLDGEFVDCLFIIEE